MAVGGGDEVDPLDAGEALPEGRRAVDAGGGERQRLHGDHPVRARGVRADQAVVGHVQADARAPAEPVGLVVAGERLHLDVHVDVRHAGERVDHDLPLELALVGEADVAELGAADAVLGGAVDGGLGPDVRAAVRRRVEHLDRVGAPERLLGVLGAARPHPLAGDRVRDEDHPAVVPGHGDPSVRHVRHVHLDLAAHLLTHPATLTHAGAARTHTRQRTAPLTHTGVSPGRADAARACHHVGVTTRLHLASTSPARLALLRSAGIEPVVLPSDVDEPAAVAAAEAGQGPLGAEAMVQLLARAKAEAVVGQLVAGAPLTGLVLGGDSAFEIDDVVHGKPHTVERATERWRAQRGREGRLHSGHWLIEVADGRIVRGIGRAAVADVRFRADITDAEIDAYVATGEPLLVAGSFTIDSLGAAFIERIQGDPSTVVGLSLPTLRGLVRELGTEWTDLWNRQGAVAARLL